MTDWWRKAVAMIDRMRSSWQHQDRDMPAVEFYLRRDAARKGWVE